MDIGRLQEIYANRERRDAGGVGEQSPPADLLSRLAEVAATITGEPVDPAERLREVERQIEDLGVLLFDEPPIEATFIM